MENTKKKSKFWFYLIPLYILIAIPLIRWTLKLSSPDIELSPDTLKTFSTDKKIKNDDFKFYEPNLEDVSYAVRYKNLEESNTSISKIYKLAESDDENNNKKSSKNASENKSIYTQQTNEAEVPKVKDIKEKEMASIGYKKGFLTDVVGKLINNPKSIKSLFDNEYVVKGFLSRDIVKKNLSDPNALKSYLVNTNAVSNFLNNAVVKQVLNNPQILNTIAQTKLVQEIMTSPAVNALLNDPNARNEILTKNPEIQNLLSNPNVINALSTNPNASKFLMGNK